MYSTDAILILVLVLALSVQGVLCLRRGQPTPTYLRWFGILTINIAFTGAVFYAMLFWRKLVLSPEFGLVMVQGTIGCYFVYVVITVIAISAAIGWHTARLATNRNSHVARPLSLGVFVAFVSIIPLHELTPLNALDVSAHFIYRYDVWWPLLPIWVSLCAVEIVLMAFNLYSRAHRLWLAAAGATVLAYYALREPLPVMPIATKVWKGCLYIFLPLSMSVATWIMLQSRAEERTWDLWKRISLTAFSAIIGLLSIHLVILYSDLIYLPWLVWLIWLMLLGIIAAYRLYRVWRTRTDGAPYLSETARKYCLLFIVFLIITLFLPQLFRLMSKEPILIMASVVITLGWIALAEAILPGPIAPLSQWAIIREIRSAESPLGHAWSSFRNRLSSAGRSIGNIVKAIFSGSWPAAILKVLTGLIVLIILTELTHVGKTVIQPFNVLVVKDTPDRLGQVISDQILNNLATIRKDLQPDDVQPQINESFKYVPGEVSTSAYTKSADLDIGGVKIPLDVLAGPMQRPLRRLLGIRVISGRLYVDEQQRYSLIASSSDGMTWKAELDLKKENVEPVADLSQKVALQIMQSYGTSLSPPESWDAFDIFRQGLVSYRRFRGNEDQNDLRDAIKKFWWVIRKDNKFAMAHYRVGLALLDDNSPGAAVEAFRESIKADPTLIAGRLALANTLLNFDRYYLPPAAVEALSSGPEAKERRREEARNLLQQVIDSNAERYLPSAYYAMCRVSEEEAQTDPAKAQDKYHLAFFYCKQAETLFAKRRAKQGSKEQRRDEAIVFNEIGAILSNSGQNSKPAGSYFSEDEFINGFTIKGLCSALENDGFKIESCTIESLNDLLENDTLYKSVIHLKQDRKPSDRLTNYIKEYEAESNKVNLKKANRLALEEYYPLEAPKNQKFEEPKWLCSAASIDDEHLNEYGKIGGRWLFQSPYTRAARTYYEQARDLLPDDPVINCNLASANYVLGDKRYMETLESDAKESTFLADGYTLQANNYRSQANNKRAHAYYRLALDEYRRLLPGSISAVSSERLEAMNGFAYTFWEWRLNLPDECGKYLKLHEAELAEGYAREAVSMADSKPDYIKAAVKSTLGEVLLALQRPQEAYEVLEEAVKLVPEHPFFHELRWDLAQAYICASENGLRAKPPDNRLIDLRKKAIELLKKIHEEEQNREYRPFTEDWRLSDPAYVRKVCAASSGPRTAIEGSTEETHPPFVLRDNHPDYSHPDDQSCDWMGISGSALNRDNEEEELILHVWGGGVNNRIATEGKQVITLGYQTRDSHDYYFAQLENKKLEPLSKIYPIETKKSCEQNMITLVFEKN